MNGPVFCVCVFANRMFLPKSSRPNRLPEKPGCHINPQPITCQRAAALPLMIALELSTARGALIRRVNSAIFQFGRALFRSGGLWHRR